MVLRHPPDKPHPCQDLIDVCIDHHPLYTRWRAE